MSPHVPESPLRRTTRALLLSVLVPGLLLVPALTAASAEPVPVAPAVTELAVSGIDPTAASDPTERALVTDGAARRTVLLTSRQATADYGLVGVTWRRNAAVGTVEAWARTRTDGAWSAWTLVGGEADEAPDATQPEAATMRAGTTPLWVGQADGVQVRVDVLSGADPQDLR
ncbi:MAG: N-acetylmuramoyl-L-alanine amidase, partial [Frankiales bacterium]|nr:N-acetylmuramoyl-L-alanine amidase [Frankiales bacterium]